MKRKITVTTGSRAEYGLLRPVLREIKQSKKLELYLIVTGMHLSKKYGLTINEITNDGFKIYTKFSMLPQEDEIYYMAKELGRGILEFSKIFRKIKPDINVILGDRDEMLASALAASHMNIPNAHIHGGDKTKAGIDENNRHTITKNSHIHFVATKKSKNRVLRMGENPKYVFLTGSPNIDEVKNNKITNKKELEKKIGINLHGDEILLVYHPVTTQTKLIEKHIKNLLNAIVKTKKTTIAIAPNSDTGNKKIFENLKLYSKKYKFIKMFKSIPRSDYLGLLKNVGVLVGNSSSGIIEASYFPLPVVNIGIRQKDREHGKNVININNENTPSIYKAIMIALRRKQKGKAVTESIYGNGNASKKIVRYLENFQINDKLLEKQIQY